MAYRLVFTKSYTKMALRFFKKHPELIDQYQKILRLLELNPHHPSLRLHGLKGKLEGLYSLSINISYRMTIEILIREQAIVPISIGVHDEVYR